MKSIDKEGKGFITEQVQKQSTKKEQVPETILFLQSLNPGNVPGVHWGFEKSRSGYKNLSDDSRKRPKYPNGIVGPVQENCNQG